MIVSAAIFYKGLVFTLPKPNRHFHIKRLMEETFKIQMPVSEENFTHGFLTDEGRFMRRRQAYDYIVLHKPQPLVKPVTDGYLTTEHLW